MYVMHLSMLCPRGGPWDRVGTLIRNKNLESNFLTLGIRFQFKVPHLGEGFELNVRHQTENFRPSEVKIDKTFIDHAAPVKGSGKACSLYEKFTYYYSLKNKLRFDFVFFSNFTQLTNSQTLKYYCSLYIYSTVTIYNYSRFSCRILKFQLRTFKFVLVLQVIVGPLAV